MGDDAGITTNRRLDVFSGGHVPCMGSVSPCTVLISEMCHSISQVRLASRAHRNAATIRMTAIAPGSNSRVCTVFDRNVASKKVSGSLFTTQPVDTC